MINKIVLLSMIALGFFQFSPSVMAADCGKIEIDGKSRKNIIKGKFNAKYPDKQEDEHPIFKVKYAKKVSFIGCTGYITIKFLIKTPWPLPDPTVDVNLKGSIDSLTNDQICYKDARVDYVPPAFSGYVEQANTALASFTTQPHCLKL